MSSRPAVLHAVRDLPLPKTSGRTILAHNSPKFGVCRIKSFDNLVGAGEQ